MGFWPEESLHEGMLSDSHHLDLPNTVKLIHLYLLGGKHMIAVHTR